MQYPLNETQILIIFNMVDPQTFEGFATVVRPGEPGPPGPYHNSVIIEDTGDLISDIPGLPQKVADAIAAELSEAYRNPPQH